MEIRVADAGDLRRVSKALREAANGKQLKRNLRRDLAAIQAPILRRAKLAWRSAPAGRQRVRGRSLRGALALATRAERRLSGREAGIRIRTDGRRMPPGMKALPKLAEGTKRPWRHPVFGDRDVWATQRPFKPGGVFYPAVRVDEAQARRQVVKAVEAVFRSI